MTAEHALTAAERRSLLGRLEAHPVLSVFVVALLVRLSAAVLFEMILGPRGLIFDDATFAQMAADAAAGSIGRWDAYTHWLYWSVATFTLPLTVLYKLFGPVTLVGRAFAAAAGAASAAIMTCLALKAVTARWALLAGMIVALLPDQVILSATTLKDSTAWLMLSLLGVVVASLNQAPRSRQPWRFVLALVVLVMLYYVRTHTFLVALYAMAMATPFGRPEGRSVRIAASLAAVVLLPAVFGLGVAGIPHIAGNATRLEERRLSEALGAGSAIASRTEPPRSLLKPTGTGRDPAQQSPVGGDDSVMIAAVRHLPIGMAAVLLRPYPWETNGSSRYLMTRVVAPLWYPVLAAALLGLVASRRHLSVLGFPVFAGAGLILVYSLAEGTIGTAFRHRGEVVGAIAVIAGVGVQTAAEWWRGQR